MLSTLASFSNVAFDVSLPNLKPIKPYMQFGQFPAARQCVLYFCATFLFLFQAQFRELI